MGSKDQPHERRTVKSRLTHLCDLIDDLRSEVDVAAEFLDQDLHGPDVEHRLSALERQLPGIESAVRDIILAFGIVIGLEGLEADE